MDNEDFGERKKKKDSFRFYKSINLNPDFIKWSHKLHQVKGREKSTFKKQHFYLKLV